LEPEPDASPTTLPSEFRIMTIVFVPPLRKGVRRGVSSD
jgi:hypothetical protein